MYTQRVVIQFAYGWYRSWNMSGVGTVNGNNEWENEWDQWFGSNEAAV